MTDNKNGAPGQESAVQITHSNSTPPGFAYSIGQTITDNRPRQCKAETWDDVVGAEFDCPDGQRSTAKGGRYLCAPMRLGQPAGKPHADHWRSEELAAPVAWVAFDFDNLTPEGFARLAAWFGQVCQCVVYPTASSTPAAPRIRIVVALNREVTPEERRRLCEVIGALLEPDYPRDPCQDRASQPLYLPLAGAPVTRCDTAPPLDADLWLSMASAVPAEGATTTAKPATPTDWATKTDAEQLQCLADLREAFKHCPGWDDYHEWIRLGQAVVGLDEAGWALWSEWSAQWPQYDEDAARAKWEGFSGARTDYRAVFAQATACGWKNPAHGRAAAAAFATPADGTATAYPLQVNMYAVMARQGGRLDDAGPMPADLSNVAAVLRAGIGGRVGFDEFQNCIVIEEPAGIRPIRDNDYLKFRERLENLGSKPVSPEIMRSAIALAADERRLDTAIAWAERLEWDGVARIDTAMSTYFGAEDTPYSRAVGAYLFTALAGRVLEPGCQADMALVLTGAQGLRKTTAVAAICPKPEWFLEADLGKGDDDLSRLLRGKIVVELSELRGLHGRNTESARAFLSRRCEAWVAKYQESPTTFLRRCIFIGTTNDSEFLDDAHGERRWLPVRVTKADVEAIERDRDQLWAEGVARFRAHGVAWAEAERLAKAEHAAFKLEDSWQGLIAAWIDARRQANNLWPFRLADVMSQALDIPKGQQDRHKQLRAARALRALGCERRHARTGWVWSLSSGDPVTLP